MRRAVITLASAARRAHVDRQQQFLAQTDPDAVRVVVWLDTEAPSPPLDGPRLVAMPPGRDGLRLAAGRNAGAAAAREAGADLLVFLDADCLAHPDLLDRYAEAAAREPGSLLCGAVTYLAEGVLPTGPDDIAALVAPHSARPSPADGVIARAADAEYALFWSLSFACTPATWDRIGGFDERYEGYGAEDTDFGFRARDRSIPLDWVGGAHAVHQHHPTSTPPWQHLDDILRNGSVFARVWGSWPMGGWLDAFAEAGAITRRDGVWMRAGDGASWEIARRTGL